MKKMNIKLLTILVLSLVLVTSFTAKNNVKATSYVYDYWKNIIPSTEGITYKETYYNTDITSVDDPTIALPKFSKLADMEVFNDTIYLLDSNLGNTTIPLADGDLDVANVSYVVVINQNFRYEKVINEFLITDEVKAKLDDFYKFTTPLDKIKKSQYSASEFLDVYSVIDEAEVVVSKEAVIPGAIGNNEAPNVLTVYLNDVKLADTDYTYSTGDTETTFNVPSASDGDELHVVYKSIQAYGRAPYVPYSGDATKAAVRLNGAQGITVAKDAKGNAYMYLADSKNARILKVDLATWVVVDVYLTPADSGFYQMSRTEYETPYGVAYETIKETSNMYTIVNDENVFEPIKVAVTASDVCYCIAANTYEGLLEFGADTTFNRYLGKNTVTANAIKQIWSKFWTEAQYSSQALDLPAMFNNITISPDGFLYATSDPDKDAVTPVNMVKIINTKGNDILKRNGYVKPDGDAVFINKSEDNNMIVGSSVLTSVAVSETGNFTITDKTRGKLFTYDSEGNLLYVTGEQPGGSATAGGGNGLSNSIISPVAVDYLYRTYTDDKGVDVREETVIVLDQYSGTIILYETTDFGKKVNMATYLYQNGVITDTYKVDSNGNVILDEKGNPIVESMGAESYWREVIKMDTNYELAYLGIGKALLRRNQYKEAMHYFELAHNAIYYSKAFTNYRDAILNENFGLLMTVVIVIVVAGVVGKVTTNINEKNKKYAMKGEEK